MTRTMRDIPMLAVDRERMRNEFDGFDDMTPEQFQAAVDERLDDLLDFINDLKKG